MIKNHIFLTVILIACITGFSSDIYTPSMEAIAKSLNTSISNIQRSMSLFMVAVAISQLIYGPLSEVYGRKKPLILGSFFTFLGSILCIFAPNIELLFLGRIMQGLGCGSFSALWRPIFRDVLTPNQIAIYGGYVGIAMVFIVGFAPTLGGYLEFFFHWKGSFIIIAAYSILLFFLISFLLPETNIHHKRERLKFYFFKKSFLELLKSPLFMGYSFCVFLTYGSFFSWFVVSPKVLMVSYNLTPQEFGLTSLFISASSMSLAGIFNAKILKIKNKHFMLNLGWSLIFISGFIFFLSQYLQINNLYQVITYGFIFLFGSTLIWPNSFSGAFAPFGHIAGYASALYSFMQLLGGSVISFFITLLNLESLISLSLTLIITSLMSFLFFNLLILPKETNKIG